MIKKLLIALLSMIATVTCAFGLTACNSDKGNGNGSDSDGNGGEDNTNNDILVDGLYLRDDGDGYTVTGVENTFLNEAVIPDLYEGKPVTVIGEYAFSNCSHLNSIHIPDSVTAIGNRAFFMCISLNSIALPDSITKIGESAFGHCNSLDFKTYGNALYLGNEGNPYLALTGVRDIENLTECTVNEKTKVISKGAFFNCDSLRTLTVEEGNAYFHSSGNCLIETQSKILIAGCNNSVIPTDGSVTAIGDSAFYSTYFSSIDIPDGVTTIGITAFEFCYFLESINIPDSVKTIGLGAFDYCGSLVNIIIPDGVETLSNYLFNNCNSLTTVTIPTSVKSFGFRVFSFCSSLTDINFKGTRSEWNAIIKEERWDYYSGNYTIHCTDGDIAKQ